jgi:hypothetical protein
MVAKIIEVNLNLYFKNKINLSFLFREKQKKE